MRPRVWVGMDLGQQYHQVAVIDESLGLVMPSFRVPRGRKGMEKLFSASVGLSLIVPPPPRIEMNGMEGDRGPFRGSERGSSGRKAGKPSEAERGPAITLHPGRRRARQRADGRQDPRQQKSQPPARDR